MAAGLTPKQKTARAYQTLKAFQRELFRAGVSTQYIRATGQRGGHLVALPGNVDGGFNISVEWSNASNGETIGKLRLYLVLRGETRVYSGWGYNAAGSFSQGLDIVKAEFKGAL